MKLAVVGAGGIGGYYGGLLARGGHEVRMLARGEHLEAIRARGLEIRTPEEIFTAAVRAVSGGDDLAGVEFVLLAVKSYSLKDVAPALRLAVQHGATVVPLLNGVDIAGELEREGISRAAILPGLTFISVAKVGPGVVERYSPFQRVVVGEFDQADSARARAMVAAFSGVGVEARVSPRIDVELWQKFIFIASTAAACGLTRAPIGPTLASAAGKRLIEQAVGETVAVGRATGIPLPADEESRTLHAIGALPGHLKPSFLLDLERGGPTEVEVLSGAVARAGERFSIPTPIHNAVVAAAACLPNAPS